MITIGPYTLLSTNFHQLPEEGEYVNQPIRTSVFGVSGSLEISDVRHDRPIAIEVKFTGYASAALLQDDRDLLESYIDVAHDLLLAVTVGSDTLNYPHTTFDSVERMPNELGRKGPYVDGSGENGWMENLCLHFTVLAPPL